MAAVECFQRLAGCCKDQFSHTEHRLFASLNDSVLHGVDPRKVALFCLVNPKKIALFCLVNPKKIALSCLINSEKS